MVYLVFHMLLKQIEKAMNKLKQTKIPVTIDEDNLMKIAVEQGIWENEHNWKLVRERDGLTKQSKGIIWLEWNEDGKFKAKHDSIAIGRSQIGRAHV